jgi:hypothetical protein
MRSGAASRKRCLSERGVAQLSSVPVQVPDWNNRYDLKRCIRNGDKQWPAYINEAVMGFILVNE